MAGNLFIIPVYVPIGVTGDPIVGARLFSYRAGTAIDATLYTDASLATPHPSPLVATALGFPPIFINPDAGFDYRFVCNTSLGALLWEVDDYPRFSAGSGGGSGTPGVDGTDGMAVAELAIHLRADVAPATPTGGSFDFAAQVLTPPAGWTSAVPAGSAPVWECRAVAAGAPATVDSSLVWSAPVKVLQDGSATDVVFQRATVQPSTPAPSTDVPLGWYTDVQSVPASLNRLWSSFGTRAHSGEPWLWQTPVQVEGEPGADGAEGPPGADGPPGEDGFNGASPEMWYIKPFGTAIKNGVGTLKVEARHIVNGVDSLLSSGDVQLFVGSTLVTEANGFATGSDGYTGFFDSGDIPSGSIMVQLMVAGGTVRDTITLVDIADGTTGTTSYAVFGYVEGDGSLAWTLSPDGTTWTPATASLLLNCTFVQAASDVARVGWLVTRDIDGYLTGATATFGGAGGDLNSGRVSVTPFGSGTRSYTARFNYSNSGEEAAVAETVITAISGEPGVPGDDGTDGAASLSLRLTLRAVTVQAYANGGVVSFADTQGYATVWEGNTDVTAAAVLSGVPTDCTVNFNTVASNPVVTQPKGYYKPQSLLADKGTFVITATFGGNTVSETYSISKSYVGYEIVTSLPIVGNFQGRIVYLTNIDGTFAANKLYRWVHTTITTGNTYWTAAIFSSDISGDITSTQIADGSISTPKLQANAVTAQKIYAGAVEADKIQTNNLAAGSVTSAKIFVTSLHVLSTNAGDIQAGMIRSTDIAAPNFSGYSASKFDLTNGRIVFDSSPGNTGGMTRVQGGGFGPGGVYLDWYGPKPPGTVTDASIIANLSDATALYFLKTDGTQYSRRSRGEFEPKAWVKFNGGTLGIYDRFNISTITRIGPGNYQVNFNSFLPNVNYAAVVTSNRNDSNASPQTCASYGHLTSSIKVITKTTGQNPTAQDADLINIVVFGSDVPISNVATPGGGGGGAGKAYGGGNVP